MRDPYLLLVWEQIAYLADDDVRLAAFGALEARVGTDPAAIERAPDDLLRRIARLGGAIAVEQRTERLRNVARRVIARWGGNLRPVLQLPRAEALGELQRYPAIGRPGAERILLLCGADPVLALDSNALRVLLRLGYGREGANYGQTYRTVQAAAAREVPDTTAARRAAFLVLRRHGQTLCRRTKPRCAECPLRADCPSAGTPGSRPARKTVRRQN